MTRILALSGQAFAWLPAPVQLACSPCSAASGWNSRATRSAPIGPSSTTCAGPAPPGTPRRATGTCRSANQFRRHSRDSPQGWTRNPYSAAVGVINFGFARAPGHDKEPVISRPHQTRGVSHAAGSHSRRLPGRGHASRRLVADRKRRRDQGVQSALRQSGRGGEGAAGLCHRRRHARAHAVSQGSDRRPARSEAADHHRRAQRFLRHQGGERARRRGLRRRRRWLAHHRHRLRADAGIDPPHRLRERAASKTAHRGR